MAGRVPATVAVACHHGWPGQARPWRV